MMCSRISLFSFYLMTKGVDMTRDLPLVLLVTITFALAIVFHYTFTKITHSEYFTLLLASAAKVDADFIVIFRQNGDFVYKDDRLIKLFAETQCQNVFTLFECGTLKPSSKTSIEDGIAKNVATEETFLLPNKEGELQRLTLHIYPLPRPKNYYVLKAVTQS